MPIGDVLLPPIPMKKMMTEEEIDGGGWNEEL